MRLISKLNLCFTKFLGRVSDSVIGFNSPTFWTDVLDSVYTQGYYKDEGVVFSSLPSELEVTTLSIVEEVF